MVEWVCLEVAIWLLTNQYAVLLVGVLFGLALAWAPRLVMRIRIWLEDR